MKKRSSISSLRWVSFVLIVSAVVLTVLQLIHFSRIRGNFPAGLSLGGVPVGELDRQQAAQRLLQVYATPVEIHYGDAVIQIKPALVGFELDLESMLAAADLQRNNQPFWLAFWDSLWGAAPQPTNVPLIASISKERLEAFLRDEVATRYDQPAIPGVPVAGSVNFQTGQAGTSLNIERSITLIDAALRSPTARVVNLTYDKSEAPRPSFQNLGILLRQIFEVARFQGVAELYLLDLQTNQELHFTYQPDSTNELPGDIAFSAESTIKIPIMVSIFKRLKEAPSSEISDLLELMIDRSENEPADQLMEKVIDPGRGPMEVTQDMQDLGLQNTFLGAFMAEPIFLSKYSTPANQRQDVFTDPDTYSQTTATDMAMLLNDIYQCAQYGGGSLIAAFPEDFNQSKCQQMVDILVKNKIGVLFQMGLPEGTRFAHKHAWAISNDGLIHTIGDAGITYTSGGNYIISGFMYNKNQLVFDTSNQLFSQISKAVYNYYNTSGQ